MALHRAALATLLSTATGCAAQPAAPPQLAHSLAPPALASAAPPAPSNNGTCWTEVGYRKGEASPVCVTRLEGLVVECGTAVVFLQMKHAAARQGVKLRIVSGFRTMKEQQVLHACHKKGKCPLAAKPGHSHHQDGLALDLNTRDRGVYDWLSRSAASFGFRRTVASEPWHWERHAGAIDTRPLCS